LTAGYGFKPLFRDQTLWLRAKAWITTFI